MDFMPFVITTDGALAPAAKKLVTTLAHILKEKWHLPAGLVMGWIRARIAMAVARASSACIRGSRTQPYGAARELEADFGDGAGVGRLFDRGTGVEEAQLRGGQ